MKTLLVATDFSESAQNAVEYAANMAVQAKAKLILFHAYHVPIVSSEVPALIFTLSEMENESLKNLKGLATRLKVEHPHLQDVEWHCSNGFVVEEIETLVKKRKIDMVVMGLQGNNFIKEKIIGSNTSALVKNALFPVMVIHQQLKYKPINRILLASDNKKISDHKIFDPLKELANYFNAHLYILNVITHTYRTINLIESTEGYELNACFNGTEHSFYELKAEDLVRGVNEFAERKKIDLTVIVARNQHFFESFLHSNQARNMIYHAHTPLLTLHE